MRLIDADKLVSHTYIIDRDHDYETYDIENAPTVEAIPVEWLLNHIPKDEVMQRYNEKLIEYLVIGWRKENETDRCG